MREMVNTVPESDSSGLTSLILGGVRSGTSSLARYLCVNTVPSSVDFKRSRRSL